MEGRTTAVVRITPVLKKTPAFRKSLLFGQGWIVLLGGVKQQFRVLTS